MSRIPKASTDDFYVGTGDKTERGDVSDASSIADQNIHLLPRWDPSQEFNSKDARITKIAEAETNGEYVCPGYQAGSDPKQLEHISPAAFFDTKKLHTQEIPGLVIKHEREP